MKHLKKFNELKSSTYKSAADKLKKIGHERRAGALLDYVGTVEEKERLQRIKDNKDKFAHTGVFRASIVFEKYEGTGKNRVLNYISPLKERGIEGEMTGNFHLALWVDRDIFEDRLWEYKSGDGDVWLNFTIGLVAADKETEDWFNTESHGVGRWDFYWDGIYSPCRPYAKITNDAGNFDPLPIGNENWEIDRFVFEGRSEAVKFKKLMLDIFEGRVEMQYDPAKEVRRLISMIPTFDKVQTIKRILEKNLPKNKFSDDKIKDMIISRLSLQKLIDSSGGDWNQEDITFDIIENISNEIDTMINELTETQYRLFIEKSVRQLKLNGFYR